MREVGLGASLAQIGAQVVIAHAAVVIGVHAAGNAVGQAHAAVESGGMEKCRNSHTTTTKHYLWPITAITHCSKHSTSAIRWVRELGL